MSQHLPDLKQTWSTALALAAWALCASCGSSEPPRPLEPIDAGLTGCDAAWAGDLQEGTALADEGLSVWGDALGNVYVAGYHGGIVGTTNIQPAGDSRAVVTKYGPEGAQVWRRLIDTPGTDTAESLVGHEDRLYALGRTTGALEGFSNGGQFDLFALELDVEGQVLRTLQAGDERPQHPLEGAVDSKGDVLVAGYEDLFVQQRQVLDAENSFVGRFSLSPPSSREWRWRSSSFFNPDRVTGLAMDSASDALYVSGYKLFEDGEGVGGAFVRRFGLEGGQPGWFTQVGFAATEIEGLLVTPSGELVAAGTTFLPLGGENLGGTDLFFTQLAPESGEQRWVTKAGTSEDDMAQAIARGPAGQLYVAGDTLGSFPGYENQGGRDLFVLELDAYGQLKRVWQAGTAGNEHAAGLWVDRCNNVFLTGYTEGSLVGSSSHLGSRDLFLMKVPLPR